MHTRTWAGAAVLQAAVANTALSLHSLNPNPTPPPPPPPRRPPPRGAPPAPLPEPAGPPVPPPYEEPLVPYTGPIEHIFFHPLIAYPERAFDGDSLARGYDEWFTTVPEFNRIISDLYKNGYVLIDLRDVFEATADGLTPRELRLPAGKKPLVISIDDLNYYEYMRENGNVFRLVLDDHGRVATYSVTPGGEESIAYDNDIIPILDAFVQEHPDFSFHGAKGLIALTGYEGILGYRTDQSEQARQAARAVVQRLKETGWSFASHSWGHPDAAKLSYNSFVRDTQRWLAEVAPLIGPTSVYIYPFGSQPPPGDAKLQHLLDSGFRILCTVGPSPYQSEDGPFTVMERRHIDGMALRTQGKMLAHLFDAAAALDQAARPKR